MASLRFLSAALIAILASCAAGSGGTPPAAPTRETPSTVTFEELSPGVWLHLSTFEIEPWGDVPSYGLVVVRDKDALLIDTAWTDAQKPL